MVSCPIAEGGVSILMVNWNTRAMTLASLQSVYRNSGEVPFEVILVDNASSDGSAEAIAAEFPQVRLVREHSNHGFAKATNIAASLAKGKYLLLLNTDTIVQDRAVERLVQFAMKNPSAQIWGGRTLYADGSLNPTSCWARPTIWSVFCFAVGLVAAFPNSPVFNREGYGGWKRNTVREVDIVTGCFFLVERCTWQELGGFDETFFMYGEEADLCARARARGAKPLLDPSATIIHFGGASASKRSDKLIYMFGARIGLVERQFRGPRRRIGRALTVFTVGWRALAYGMAAKLIGAQYLAARSAEWNETWKQRAIWRSGPVTSASLKKSLPITNANPVTGEGS